MFWVYVSSPEHSCLVYSFTSIKKRNRTKNRSKSCKCKRAPSGYKYVSLYNVGFEFYSQYLSLMWNPQTDCSVMLPDTQRWYVAAIACVVAACPFLRGPACRPTLSSRNSVRQSVMYHPTSKSKFNDNHIFNNVYQSNNVAESGVWSLAAIQTRI